MKKQLLFSFILFSFSIGLFAQAKTAKQIKTQIASLKKHVRGPYRDIRWFCKDGSVRAAKDPCPDSTSPGVQHARYKKDVVALGKKNHIFLGQILTYTDKVDFWDATKNHSRLKQYQLQKYLSAIDNGWINRRGQYYRGAVQAEDEADWGVTFFRWLLRDNKRVEQHYFLIRESLRDIPHQSDDNLAQKMRNQSRVIADLYSDFMDLRIKIHGRPDISDVKQVKAFKTKHSKKLTKSLKKQFDNLIATMTLFYKPIEVKSLTKIRLSRKSVLYGKINTYITANKTKQTIPELVTQSCQLLYDIRAELLNERSTRARLQLLDLSLKLETIIYRNASKWIPSNLEDLLSKIRYLSLASVGSGYIEKFEWQLHPFSKDSLAKDSILLGDLVSTLNEARNLVEWSTAMMKANYQYVVNQYGSFEPLVYGFIDNKIRGTLTLHLGKSVSDLGNFIALETSLTNQVMNLSNQSSVRGLNPGYALGELVVVNGSPEGIEVKPDKIYVFQHPPTDLEPVAGIATVSEGNMVSHVQLLARNLGIPNVALSSDNLDSLVKFSGQKVFYAVSNKGNVILKAEKDMTIEEKALFSKKERKDERITVPVEQIQLAEKNILDLRNIDASHSGKLCGPKAANLGQLKKMFPDKVVEGLVIPFGIFKEHMDQAMPEQNGSYWDFLNAVFNTADTMRQQGIAIDSIERFQLEQLAILRAAIQKMPLKAEFVQQLEGQFKAIFNKDLGKTPVFVRSDTNMEDLKDFTGAGLNLTLFNVVNKTKILEGIKAVWASPYRERSFKWRQVYLLNPENVYPSILIIPSVNVDYSGVLITKGINQGDENDLTVAFSRGVGGAVDGQVAESYLIKNDTGFQFLAPAREMYYKSLPETGGVNKKTTTLESPLLNVQNINDLRTLAHNIRRRLPKETQSDYQGAYDVELGFKDNKIWLFQIRPFVENKKALSSDYLESITPSIDKTQIISLSKKI